ncbi:CHAT domain-containing tetratricopeptide repeat protein [bacterium]|nr:CHAT domain-containing tetratricopeptide repeat protein [bacterium]
MFFKRIAQYIGTLLLITILTSGACWSQTSAKKARILAQLTQATKAQLPARVDSVVRTNTTESSQLTIDLIVYKWMVRLSELPIDVTNINTVIPALAKKLNNPSVNAAQQLFSTVQPIGKQAVLNITRDEKTKALEGIRAEFMNAIDYKESYPTQAVDSLVALVEMCQGQHLDISEAVVLKELGDHYLYGMSRYLDAEECYKTASLIFTSYSCIRSSAIVYDDYGWLDFETGRYSAAMDNYTLAAQQWMLLAGQDASRYRYRDLAGREYMRAGDASRAAGDTSGALQLMTAYGLDQLRTWAHATKSYSELVTNLISVAELCKDRGDITRALSLLNEAKLAPCDATLTAKTYEMLSEVYAAARQSSYSSEAMRKREKALISAAAAGEAAISGLQKDTPSDKARQAKAEQGAYAYVELGNYDKSASAWSRIADIYSAAGIVVQRVESLRKYADALYAQGKSQEAMGVRLDAAMTARKANKMSLAADIVLYDMVPAFKEMGDINNAIEGFKELVPILGSSGNRRAYASVLEARGILFEKYRQYDKAISDLQEARIRYSSQVGDSWAACDVSLKLAEAQRKAGRDSDALSTLETSLGIIESNAANDRIDPAINSFHSDVIMNVYCDLASSYVLADRPADAKTLLQKVGRYTWLPERINRMKTDTNPKIAQFAQTLDIISGGGQTNDNSISGGERLLADNWADFWHACLMFRKQNPLVFNALPVDPLDLCRKRDMLPRMGTVVEYMFTDTAVYVFICKYEKSVCRQIRVSRQDLDKQISDLRAALNNCEDSQSAGIPTPPINDWQSQSFTEIRKPLEGLYNILIAPIKQDIESAKTLHFALPDELAGIPMHALLEPSDPNADYVPKFLIKEYGVSYLGHGMLDNLIDEDSRIDSKSDWLAIFVDPDNNLPGAQEEARTIKALYLKSGWYVGQNATSANFLKEAGRASVLHIAAHHKVDPGKFELKLASQAGSDGSVTIDELISVTNPHLNLVVLSACDSVGSSDPISSGPSSAAEVFSMVGAKSILGGLWKVSDKSASSIMGGFYRDLTDGETRIESLQSAQLAAIDGKQYAHPFYWACFALYGCPW